MSESRPFGGGSSGGTSGGAGNETAASRPGTLGRNPAPDRGPDGLLEKDFRVKPPTVTLPQGGGALAPVGEKVTANPATGSATASLPLPTTPGRSGFTPRLSLTY